MTLAQLNPADGLPSSPHTEVAILGAMLLDPVAVADAVAKLEASDFSLDSNQRVFRAMLSLQADEIPIDYLTVRERLTSRRELDAIGGPSYLAYLSEGIPRNFNIESYARIVKEKSLLRQLMGIFHESGVQASDPSEDGRTLIDQTIERLQDARDATAQEGGLRGIAEIIETHFHSVDELCEQGRPEITGLKTHYTDFDRMTSGLQGSELIIIAARPSMGKTAWAINIAQNAAVLDGKIVAIFSLEMSEQALFQRLLASQARVSTRGMQNGFIGEEGKRKVMDSVAKLTESNLFIDDTSNLTIAQMRSKVRRLEQQKKVKLDLIVVDYLQLMTGTNTSGKKGFENRTQEVSSISRGLKALAKETKIPVVALSQLSRGSEQRSGRRRPLLSDLRESGSIEQDADVVAFIHREEYYDHDDEDLKGKAEIIVAKQRNGPTGTIDLVWIEQMTRFENLAGSEPAAQQSGFDQVRW